MKFMKNKIVVRPLGRLAKLADILMVPLMYLISGTFKEVPQRGHVWNNMRLSVKDVKNLDRSIMVHCAGMQNEKRRRWLFLFHIPIFGGWKNYVVFEPVNLGRDWYVGCIANDIIGASRIKLSGKVRMLVDSSNVSFFGIDAISYKQISIKKIGMGRIGDGSEFAKEKLF